jgi:uncharacterized membrane protein
MLDYIAIGIGMIVVLTLMGLYIANIWKLITQLNNSQYTLFLVLRLFGVFFPILGIILGAVKVKA